LVRALLLCIDDKSLKGPINATAPHAVSNREFSRALGHALHRPSWFRVPELTLKAALGEGAEPILTGQRAVPRVLQNAGFHWQFPELPGALQQALAS
jgi:hypothetical protein